MKRIVITVTSLILALSISIGVCALNRGVSLFNNTDRSDSDNLTDKIGGSDNYVTSQLASSTGYSHNVTVDSDGVFNFQFEGKTYKNEYERLLAEDGFMYGVNWDWFGTWQQQTTNLGTDNIIHKNSYFRADYFKRVLYNLKAMGFNCLANWIGPRGTYTYDEFGFITGLEETFVTNLIALLDACRETGMDFVPGLLTHYYGEFRGGRVIDGLSDSERFHKYFRFYYDEDAREAYINNGINKVCEILKDYQDVIPVIALTIENGSKTNDVYNGMLYSPVAPTWEDFAKLNNAMHDSVKTYMPNMLTSVEDIGGWPGNIAKYNDLKVDIQGFNNYTSTDFHDISSLMLTKPAYLGEFDVFHDSDDYKSTTQEYLDRIRETFYEKAVKGGYVGAFYYPFHYNETSEKSTFFTGSSADRYDQLRGWVVSSAYTIHDLKNEHRGTLDADTPALFYNNGTRDVYFLGGRNVDHYVLERSDNGANFKVVSDKINSADNMISNGLIRYTDNTLSENNTYAYRVKAVFEDGTTTVSKVGNSFKLFVPEESFVNSDGEYIGGFEKGFITGTNIWPNSNGWYKDLSWMSVMGVVSTSDPRTGNNSLMLNLPEGIGNLASNQHRFMCNLTLKPNTQYKLSMWSKNTNCMLGFSVLDKNGNQLVWTYPAIDTEETDEWKEVEITFMSPEDGCVRLRLARTFEETDVYNIDDISIKETR